MESGVPVGEAGSFRFGDYSDSVGLNFFFLYIYLLRVRAFIYLFIFIDRPLFFFLARDGQYYVTLLFIFGTLSPTHIYI